MALPAYELAGWMDYHKTVPFDDDRQDYRTAKLQETLYSIAKGFVVKHSSWKFFMPDYFDEFKIEELVEKARINEEVAYSEYLETLDDNGNQTTRPS